MAMSVVAFTLPDIMGGFGVEPRRGCRRAGARYDAVVVGETGIDDPIFDWFLERGEIGIANTQDEIGRVGEIRDHNGWTNIICPWPHNSPGRTANYRPAGVDTSGRRCFRCKHDGCAQRSTYDLLRWVRDQGGPDMLAEIEA